MIHDDVDGLPNLYTLYCVIILIIIAKINYIEISLTAKFTAREFKFELHSRTSHGMAVRTGICSSEKSGQFITSGS